jgi:predicted alpha-1,2-mannosidase
VLVKRFSSRRSRVIVMILIVCLLGVPLFFTMRNLHATPTHASSSINAVAYVNPLIGTSGPGNTFPGVDAPFGMVQWSPDTTSTTAGASYNYASTTITDFSLTHLSGAGCNTFRDVPFMPFVGQVQKSPGTDSAAYAATFSHSKEIAQAGYYSVVLNSGVKVELTATQHSGFGQFTYPASTSATMLVSTTSVTGNTAASVTIIPGSNEVTGMVESGNFCGTNGPYTLYFAAQFQQPFTGYGTWKGSTVKAKSTSNSGSQSGAYVTFNTTQNSVVLVKVGLSYVSIANALANIQAENSGWSFTSTESSASNAWNTALNSIQVSGGSTQQLTTFYTSLYHSLLFPSVFSDTNGQYMGYDGKVHTVSAGHAQYANFSGWDIYHGLVPLQALLFPQKTSDMMQSLVSDYEQSGCLPKWGLANYQTDIEDGDSADPILAEAYAFGATSFDTSTALQAMLKGANQTCTSGSYIERQGLSQYLSLHYIPYGTAGLNGTASATLEYTSDDFAISQFAGALGDGTDAATFKTRSHYWQNLFNSKVGYIEPRDSNGNFVTDTSGRVGFHGGTDAQYTWMIPYDLADLFKDLGGNQAVVSKLNTYFTQLNAGKASRYAYMGNEPSSPDPWEYDFAGQPWNTQNVVREVVNQLYTDTTSGLPGNDDLGQTSSWNVWASIGFFPEYPGAGDLVIGSPLFSSITLNLGTGHTVTINSSGAATNAPYVQSLLMNGAATSQLWVPFSALAPGASFQFTLGTNPNTSWGTASGDTPPSF